MMVPFPPRRGLPFRILDAQAPLADAGALAAGIQLCGAVVRGEGLVDAPK